MRFQFRSWAVQLLAVAVFGSMHMGSAAGPAIGMVKAMGSFRVDHAAVQRSGTLFEGNLIEAENVPSEAWLDGGARLLLDSGSRCRIYRDRVLLEQGGGQLRGSDQYAIEARDLRILLSSPAAAVQVALNPASHVEVAALVGAAQVWTSRGVLVATIPAGRALDLDSEASAAAPESRLTGCLRQKSGKFLVTDETTNVTAELRGSGLDKQVGNLVEVEGATIPGVKAAGGASQVIQVSDLKPLGRRCSVSGKAAAGAAGAAGISKTTVLAIVGGVAAAGTATGVAVTRGGGEEKPPVSP